jgi:glucose dehydrogenase
MYDESITYVFTGVVERITYTGRNGKQYVAVVAATQGQTNNESLHVFALP